jgi:hypothetical protein
MAGRPQVQSNDALPCCAVLHLESCINFKQGQAVIDLGAQSSLRVSPIMALLRCMQPEAVASSGKGHEFWRMTHTNYGTRVARRPHRVFEQCRQLSWNIY